MNVVNVLIQVRVFKAEKAVKNLKKEDFRIFEDNQPQKIENFFTKSEKIGLHEINMTSLKPGSKSGLSNARYFVLIFRITEFPPHLKTGIDYFFNHILQPQDELLVFANEKTLLLNTPLINNLTRKDLVIQTLREEARKSKNDLKRYFVALNNKHNLPINDISSVNLSTYAFRLINYIESYSISMRDYINRHLKPDLPRYYNFARYLQNIRREKWIINFLQTDLFPNLETVKRLYGLLWNFLRELSRSDRSLNFYFDYRSLGKRLNRISQLIAQTKDLSEKEISKLFYKIKATFHTIFFSHNTLKVQNDMEKISLSNNLTFFLKKITQDTGGELLLGNNLDSALHQISQKENTFYLLSYTPSNPEKIGKIEIKVSNPDYKVIYDDNLRSDYISEFIRTQQRLNPKIIVENLGFTKKQLSFTVAGYKMDPQSGNGNIITRIIIKDKDNRQVYNEDKSIKTRKSLAKFSVNFDWLKDGKYYFIVETRDVLTGHTSMDLHETIVSKYLD